MRMFASFVNLQLGHQHSAEPIFRDHAANSMGDQLFGVLCPDLCDRPEPLSTLPPGIAHELLVSLFFAGESDFFGIDDYPEIPGVEGGGKNRFARAAQAGSDR